MLLSPLPVFASSYLLSGLNMPWLRILQINDVYELDNFPHLKTLIDKYSKESGPDQCITICAGDFLAPSLLSSLDKGAGMVDILNQVGCDYVCLGNHENDVGAEALGARIEQSNFVWINSNMAALQECLDVTKETPRYQILEVGDKKVALLGLLTDDKSLYRPGAFGGAIKSLKPVLETAKELADELKEKVDVVLPMTHQGIDDDRKMAQEMGDIFPLLMGGHDHEPYLETSNDCQIVKAGTDAVKAAVIDVQWQDEEDSGKPTIQVELLDVKSFAKDPALQKRVDDHHSILKELDNAKLFAVKDWVKPDGNGVFSTLNNRLKPSTGSTALASMLRMGLRCEICLMSAGSIRASREYPPDHQFTWADLKAEVPFSTEMCVCKVPGKVLQDDIIHSRRKAPEGVASGGYLHTSRTTVCSEDGTIETVLGHAFDPDKEYLTAFPYAILAGIDNHQPFLEWAKTKEPHELPSEEAGIPAKLVLVELLSALFWLRMGSFEEMAGDDGEIGRADVVEGLKKLYGGNADIADLMADSVFKVADKDKNGTISATEQMCVHFVAADMLNHIPSSGELQAMKKAASQVLGQEPAPEELDTIVEELRSTLDLGGNGTIQREEIIQALGEVAGKDLLH